MEKFGDRESVLLGSSFRNSPKSLHSHSSGGLEMDFNDVFGGPPRRFSNQEVSMRYSFTETVESEEGSGSSLPAGRSRWSGCDEKPVFGSDEEGIYRRQLSGNDFYDDIFRGDNSKSYHSPTSTSFDLLASNPGSRVLSPSRGASELSSSSVPAQLSFAAKLTKAIDYPGFGLAHRMKLKNKEGVVVHSSGMDSPNASSSTVVSLSRFSSQAKDLFDDVRSEVSGKNEESSSSSPSSSSFRAEPSGGQKRNEVAKDSKSFETPKNSSQFHFSIYRWAGNGVPMLMPLIGSRKWRSTGRRKMERCLSNLNGKTDKESIDMKMENFEEYIVSVDSHESDTLKVNIEDPEEISDAVKKMSHDVRNHQNPQILNTESIQTAKERERPNPKIELDSKGKIGITTYRDKEPILKLNAKALGDLLGKEKDKGIGIAMDEGVTTPRANRTADIRSRQTNSNVDDTISSKKSPKTKGDASIKLRAEGKVREFVKIFNQETSSPKTKVTPDPQSQSSRSKGVDIKGKDIKPSKVAEVEVDAHPHKQTMADVSSKDGDNFNTVKVEEEVNLKSSNKKTSGLFADKKNDSNFSDPSPEAKVEDNEDVFEGHFQVEELSNIEDKDLHSSGDPTDIKALDAKIHQWSSGRKGNIRSLLSTLHYVLWADSGWKPIPLVDIIEANAVNRAYRKAMLYLHPDKLQQKGAASHQKYTARKVFEILQEAWDHFNTLGAI